MEGNIQDHDHDRDDDEEELYQYSDSGSGTVGSGTVGSQANTSIKSQGSAGVHVPGEGTVGAGTVGAGTIGSTTSVTGLPHSTGGPFTLLPSSTSPPPTISPPIPSVVTSREGSVTSMRLASIPEGSGSGSASGQSEGSDLGGGAGMSRRTGGGREGRDTKSDQASTSSSAAGVAGDDEDDQSTRNTNINTWKDIHALLSSFRIKATCPFNSTTKIAYTAVQRGRHVYVLAKGAPELILTRCTHYVMPPSVELSDAHSGSGPSPDDFKGGDTTATVVAAAAHADASAVGRGSVIGASGVTRTNNSASGNEQHHGCRPLPITKEIRRQLQRHLIEESSKGQRVVALALRVENIHNHHHHHNHSHGHTHIHSYSRGNDQRDASTPRTTGPTTAGTPTRKKNYGGGRGGGEDNGSDGKDRCQSSGGDFPYAPDGLTFIGFLSISDPPREGVREAVLLIRGAGIVVAMVTGDAPEVSIVLSWAVNRKSCDKRMD